MRIKEEFWALGRSDEISLRKTKTKVKKVKNKMAIYHLHSQFIGRSSGRSIVAASAYRSASRLVEEGFDKESGLDFERVHDYRNKDGVVFSEIIAPENSSDWMKDREELWNRVQNDFEKRRDSVFAQEMDIALPVELNEEQNIELVKSFVRGAFVNEGMIADVNVHYDNPDNPHFHVLLSTREIVWDQSLGEGGEYTFGNKVRYWGKKEFLQHIRRNWAGSLNEHLKMHGIDKEVSHLSYKELGIDLKPGIKEGRGRRIAGSDRGKINSEVAKFNEESLRANPEMVVDLLRRDRAVFTRDDVSSALLERLDYSSGSSNDSESGGGGESTEIKGGMQKVDLDVIQGLDKEMLHVGRYLSDLSGVMESDKVVPIGARDLEGRELFTSRERYELEKDLTKRLQRLKGEYGVGGELGAESAGDVSKHSLGVSEEDLQNGFGKTKVRSALEHIGFVREVKLSLRQSEVALSVLNGGNVSVVEGLPGAGKTTVMGEVARVYKGMGYKVLGTAVSSSAASELGERGIKSMNITKLRYETELARGAISGKEDFKVNLPIDYFSNEKDDLAYNGSLGSWSDFVRNIFRSGSILDKKSVLIVDEASMLDLTEMHWVVREIEKSGAKLILLGDRGQLSSVGIGGGLEKMSSMFGVHTLDEVRRQTNTSHREVTKALASFRISDAIDIYRKGKVFNFGANLDEVRSKLISDYVRDYIEAADSNSSSKAKPNKSMVALSYTNEEVDKLNAGIRSGLKEAGIVWGSESEFTDRRGRLLKFAKGDRIVFGENSKFLGVYNGDTGRVVGFGRTKPNSDNPNARETIIISLDRGAFDLGVTISNRIEVDNHFYKSLAHGFAVNIHKVQGRTYDFVYGLIDKYLGYNSFNVMATRHKDKLSLYAPKDGLEDELKASFVKGRSDEDNWQLRADEKDKESVLYAGLHSLISKRGDKSLVQDWESLSSSPKARLVSDYLEARSDAINMSKAIDEWVRSERLVGRNVTRENHEYYADLKDVLSQREVLAKSLIENYGEHKDILIQAGVKYTTLEKHAGEAKYNYFFEYDKSSGREVDGNHLIYKSSDFKELIESLRELRICEEGVLFNQAGHGTDRARSLIKDIAKQIEKINSLYGDRRERLDEVKTRLEDTRQEKQSSIDYLKKGKEYREVILPSFIKKTYKSNFSEVMNAWEELKDQVRHGSSGEISTKEVIDSSLVKLKNKPQILGDLKGVGLGTFISLSPSRFRASVNAEGIDVAFAKYEETLSKSKEIESNMASGEYDKKVFDLSSAHRGLKLTKEEIEIEGFIGKLESLVESDILSSKSKDFSKSSQTLEPGAEKLESLSFVRDQKNNILVDAYGELAENTSNRDKNLFKNFSSGQRKEKTAYAQRNIARVSFEEVSNSLVTSDYENIFRKYANMINPDGSVEKRGSEMICGSLRMNLDNGLWHRFSTGEGGNIFSLVKEAEGVSLRDALERVGGFKGVSSQSTKSTRASKMQALDAGQKTKIEEKKQNEWVPLSKVPEGASEFNPRQHIGYMLAKNDVGGIYTYKNSTGEIIGHSVRLIDKESGKKQVLPVSYCKNEDLGREGWRLKGFTDEKGNKPIYGLEKLGASDKAQKQIKPILIVEGEKTADEAQKLLPDYNVISWMGGAQGVGKVDWSQLKGDKIIIWPDNDEAGKVCAKQIASNLKNNTLADEHGIGISVKIINPSLVGTKSRGAENLIPAKWDLADTIPKGLDLSDIKEALRGENKLDASDTQKIAKDLCSELALSESQRQGLDKTVSRMILKEKYLGYEASHLEIKEDASKHMLLDSKLGSLEVKNYLEYSKARSQYAPAHEYMDLENKLYKESLISIGKGDRSFESMFKAQGKIDGALGNKEHDKHQGSEGNVELLHKLEDKYRERLDVFTDHIEYLRPYMDVLSVSSEGSVVGNYNGVKTKNELFRILVRDIMLIQKLFLEESLGKGGARLYDGIKKEITEEAYKLVQGLKYNKIGEIERGEFKRISEALYEKFTSGDYWSEQYHHSDKEASKHLESQIAQREKADKFDKKYGKELDRIDSSKREAKDLNEYCQALKVEKKLLDKIAKDNNLSVSSYEDFYGKHYHLKENLEFYDKHQDGLNQMMDDIKNLDDWGFKVDKRAFSKISEVSHKELFKMFERDVSKVAISMVEKNIDKIYDDGFVKVGSKRFTHELSYIKFEMEDRKMDRYLHKTEYAEQYHDMKEYCKEHKISDHQYIKSMEHDKGMEM